MIRVLAASVLLAALVVVSDNREGGDGGDNGRTSVSALFGRFDGRTAPAAGRASAGSMSDLLRQRFGASQLVQPRGAGYDKRGAERADDLPRMRRTRLGLTYSPEGRTSPGGDQRRTPRLSTEGRAAILLPAKVGRVRTPLTAYRQPAHFGHPDTWFRRQAPDSAKARILRGRIRHAADVERFFASHPQLAQTARGRDSRWQHRRMGRWARRELQDVETHMHREAVVRRLARVLAGTPMEGSARALERVAWRYHISPYFIVAAAGTEAGDGTRPGIHGCSSNFRNVWGLSSCGPGWYVPHFRSWQQAYAFYARFLRSRWPHATTTHHFYGYARCSACWGRKTAEWMRSLFGVGPGVRYL